MDWLLLADCAAPREIATKRGMCFCASAHGLGMQVTSVPTNSENLTALGAFQFDIALKVPWVMRSIVVRELLLQQLTGLPSTSSGASVFQSTHYQYCTGIQNSLTLIELALFAAVCCLRPACFTHQPLSLFTGWRFGAAD
jgi:hypothetical protein